MLFATTNALIDQPGAFLKRALELGPSARN